MVNTPTATKSKAVRSARASIVRPAPAGTTSSSAATPNITQGLGRANVIAGQHVVDTTHRQYAQTFKFITRYCADHLPGSVDANGELIIPMSMDNLKAFLGDMGAAKEDKSLKAISTVAGYITVIKHYYKERLGNARMSDEQQQYLKKFHDGYKRVVAQAKNNGDMKQKEGSRMGRNRAQIRRVPSWISSLSSVPASLSGVPLGLVD